MDWHKATKTQCSFFFLIFAWCCCCSLAPFSWAPPLAFSESPFFSSFRSMNPSATSSSSLLKTECRRNPWKKWKKNVNSSSSRAAAGSFSRYEVRDGEKVVKKAFLKFQRLWSFCYNPVCSSTGFHLQAAAACFSLSNLTSCCCFSLCSRCCCRCWLQKNWLIPRQRNPSWCRDVKGMQGRVPDHVQEFLHTQV